MISLLSTNAQAQFAGGDGSSGDPYQIETPAQLNEVRNDLSAHYILIADIDLTTVTGDPSGTYWNGGEGWEPMGDFDNPFTGSIDGGGYTITGLFIDRFPDGLIGLFGETGVGSEFTNMGLVEVNITGGPYTGSLVGRNWGTITGSYVTGRVSGDLRVGGLVGGNRDGSITGSYATGSVTGSARVGGLVGENFVAITNSYATGDVTGSNSDVGGLIGINIAGSITDSYATGEVDGDDDVGGFVGDNLTGTIATSYWNTETSGQTTAVGDGSSAGVTGLTSEQMRQKSSFTGFDFTGTWQIDEGIAFPVLQNNEQVPPPGYVPVIDSPADGATRISLTPTFQWQSVYEFVSYDVQISTDSEFNTLVEDETGITGTEYTLSGELNVGAVYYWRIRGVSGFGQTGWTTAQFRTAPSPNGAGTEDDPWEIATADQLHAVRYYLGDHYIQTANIDLTTATDDASGTYWNGGEGWEPISTIATPFTGSINGAGHTITGLFINRPANNNNALIRRVGSGGTVENIHLVEVDITGLDLTGGLVARNDGAINGSSVTGSVSGNSDVGGLVGYNNDGTVSTSYATGSVSGNSEVGELVGNNGGSVTNSYAMGSVSGGSGSNLGGLVGANKGTITSSYATGSVSGSSFVGGLVGVNVGTVTDSYATGSVSGDNRVGGLVGNNANTVTTSYATGSVSGDNIVGGLVGANGDTITDSYWNTETSDRANGVGAGSSAGVIGLTSEQMRQEGFYTSFDFDNYWEIESGLWSSYPYLKEITYDEPGTEPEVNPIPGLFGYTPDENNILYVDQDAEGDGSGNSWPNAIPELRDALDWAQNWDGDTDGTLQIWVAEGIYLPTDDESDRFATFQLVNDVEIYGGFDPDNGDDDFNDRDWNKNLTILTGDIDGNDENKIDGVVTDADNIIGSNSYHVVTGSGTDDTARLDGFTITAGLTEGTTFPTDSGAGLLNDEGAPVLAHLVITGNSANYGGGMYIRESSPTLTNVLFAANEAEIYGGGLYITGNSAPVLTAVVVSGNSAGQGGGMYNSSSDLVITGGLFEGNSASYGGGMYNSSSSPILTNVTLTGNTAGSNGGGMVNIGDEFTESTPALRNVIIWDNSADGDSETTSASFYNINATPAISHSLIANAFDGDTWETELGTNGGSNLDTDPQFVNASNPAGADNIFGTDDDGLALQNTSPAINAGNNEAVPDGVTTDLAGNARIFDGETDVVDMGAYEFQGEPFSIGPDGDNILYVDQGAEGDGSGNSWTNAIPELRDALAWAEDEWDGETDGTLQIWVADGLYLPTDDADREASFQMINHVEIYGGFAGDEDPDGFNLADRDFEANETALSGDIGVEDDDSDNAYHVFYHHPDEGSNLDNSAVLDGVTISAGRADGLGIDHFGAGMYNNNNSPTLMNVTFKDNISFSEDDATYGGGMYNENSDPVLANVIFNGNEAQYGGAMHNRSGSSPTLTNAIINGNEARFGGGMYNHQSSPTWINVLISGNNAIQAGGGVLNYKSSPILTNVTISGNTDGGMVNTGGSYPILKNSIVWGNSGSDINDRSGGPFGTNSTTIENSIVSGEDDPENGNVDEDPLFVDPISSGSAPTTGGDYRLQADSPAISAGDNEALPDDITSDLGGNPRIDAVIVDMGAYEFQGASPPITPDGDNILYVDQNVEGGNETGNSWANAIPELRDALAWAEDWNGETDGILQIWVAEGLYLPADDHTDRDASFQLVDNVQIYGGFEGNENDLNDRDWDEYLTILSGDIDGNDDEDIITNPETQIKGGNSYRVVLLDGTTNPITSSTVIDGFTITAGQEDSGISNNGGGGLRCDGSGPDGECSPVIRNINFSGNMTVGYGGGMYIGIFQGTSNPIITNVVFNNNWAKGDGGSGAGWGGGLYHTCSDGESNPVFTNVIFRDNSADLNGGGIVINPGNGSSQCSPVFTNALFTGNSAKRGGGAIYNSVGGNISLTNGTFSGNQAERRGGAVLNGGEMTIANSIFRGNSADEEGDEFLNGGTVEITNSTLNVGDSDDVVSSGTLFCTNCSDLDPLFSDPANGDFTLASNSPAINMGTNTPYQSGGDAEGITTDLAGNDRIYDGGTVDMGAYEFQGDPDEIPQGEDQRLLVGNHAPTVFSGNDFSLNSSVETVRIIGFSGFGSLELDGSDVGDGDEIPAEDISNNLLAFIPAEGVAYGYDYAELTFQLIDDAGRVSEESASINIDVAATSVELTGGEGWRFLGNPSDGDSFDDLLEPIWTKGMAGSDSPGATFSNVNVINQQEYQWEIPADLGNPTEAGQPFIVYVYSDDDNDGTPEGFPKILTSGQNWLPLNGAFSFDELGYGESSSNPDNFYLVANPHPIALDFCEFAATNIGTAVTFWNPNANSGDGDYQALNCATLEDLPIAPFQAFWIRTTDTNPALVISEDAYLETGTEGYFKEPQVKEDLFRIVLNVESEEQQKTFSNRTELYFSENATATLDEMDAPKLSPEGLAPRWLSFYSLDENHKAYAFQSLPVSHLRNDKVRIPLNVQTTEPGRFTLDWTLPETHIFNGSYFLRDNQTGEVIELREGSKYFFDITTDQTSKSSDGVRSAKSLGDFADLGMAAGQPSDRSKRSDGSTPRFELLITAAGVDGLTELGAVPEKFELAQNYPNPFNPTTVISYQLPVSSEVRLEVYDMLGRNVATLVNGQVSAGRHAVNFDAGNLSSGIYLYRLQAGNQIMTRKLTVVK